MGTPEEEEPPQEQPVLPTDIELPKRQRRRHSRRPCPRCGRPMLVRLEAPFYLRPFRLVGLRLRPYECEVCGKRVIMRRRKS